MTDDGDELMSTHTSTSRRPSRGFWRTVYRYGTPLGTLVLAVATAILVIVTWQQVGLTRRQLELLDAHNRRSARAYLLFDSGRLEKQGEHYKVILRVKNSGQTPAYHVRHSWGMGIYDFPLPFPKPFGPIRFEPVNERQSVDIGAGSGLTLDDLPRLALTKADKAHIAARTRAVYVWAKLEYKDTFRETQCTALAAVNVRDGIEEVGWDLRVFWHDITDDRSRNDCSGY